ncbi:MAG: cyclic nucleotide-binding domain-containing protein [Desulfobacteraceae bacterium]|nr:cyclic nucleotide-binding domain-containing protein [Desulfobacteraceae bacterium]
MKELKIDDEKARDLFYKFKKNSILKALSLADLVELFELSPLHEYDNGEYIIKQGKLDDFMFILLSGEIEIVRDKAVINTLGTIGEVVGEMRLINNEKRSASVRAKGKVECLAINTSYLGGQRTSPQSVLFYIFSRILARRLKTENQKLSDARNEIKRLKEE